jgi:hypothetical protein
MEIMYTAVRRMLLFDGKKVKCQICKLKINLSEGYFRCRKQCDYDFCFDCVQNIRQELPRKYLGFAQKSVQCSRGHPLLFRGAPLSNNTVNC